MSILKTKLRLGDRVMITSGKFKGRIDKISGISLKKGFLFLENLYFFKKRKKNNSDELVEERISFPVRISKVSVLLKDENAKCKIRFVLQEGKKFKKRILVGSVGKVEI